MTRFLSQALGALEPAFSQGIQQLERAAGAPGADIRLTAETVQRTRTKIAQLGLDPADTNGPEFYQALTQRLKQDEAIARQALDQTANAGADDIVTAAYQFVTKQEIYKNCFALKPSVARRLLKKKPPKLVMKSLGYRSLDSMLKQEQAANIYAAAAICESAAWHKSLRDQYSKLTPSDFETRSVTLTHPKTKHWQELADNFVDESKHNILTFPELGSIVILPVRNDIDGLAIITLLMLTEEINRLRTYSSYVKLQQVKPNFGTLVQNSLQSENNPAAQLAGQAVSWKVIQRYYARYNEAYHPEIFEPHVQPEDLQWGSGEDLLAKLDDRLQFWQGSETLGLLDTTDGAIVSCNALDVALSCCNKLPYISRVVHFVRDNLWHELMMRYLHQENLENAVRQQLAGNLSEGIEA
jgi:hypothetical protein